MSKSAFLARGARAIAAEDAPVLIDWADEGDDAELLAQLLAGVDGLPVALFRKSADPATRSRSDVTMIRLEDFLANDAYRAPINGFVHRVVANIRTRPELIDSLLGQRALDVFDYSGSGASVNLWINHRGQFGRAHFDELENFNLQLIGAKRFILAPPGRRNFYVRSMLKGFGHHSDFPNLLDVDSARYPRYLPERSKLQEAVLTPGRMLYIPIGWWHQVESLGALNINMNFWLPDRKIMRRPYVLVDAVYKAAFRRVMRRYDYQPAEPMREAVAP